MTTDLLTSDAFAVFGLPRRFQVDKVDLRGRYQTLMRAHHPDTIASSASAMDKLRQQQIATRINTAHDTLADPLRRAQCLLTLLGHEAENHKRSLPNAFLLEQLTWREKIDETSSTTALMAMTDELAQHEADCQQQLQQLFAQHEGRHTLSDQAAAAIGLCLRQWQFWRKLTEAIDEKLDD